MYQIFLPYPNPPLIKGSHCVGRVPRLEASGVRELDFIVSSLTKGGLRGVIKITVNHFSNKL